jgi:Trp operon repressor
MIKFTSFESLLKILWKAATWEAKKEIWRVILNGSERKKID